MAANCFQVFLNENILSLISSISSNFFPPRTLKYWIKIIQLNQKGIFKWKLTHLDDKDENLVIRKSIIHFCSIENNSMANLATAGK